ncbi:MAG: ABC transporter permease [Ruminococcus sp.]|nr:ABC transporter permease [Ruminococcus sp.]
MKTALLKDTFREVKRTAGRFLSLFAIVALGCGFFAGIKATMPDMVDSANDYFEENRLMDYKMMSTVGVRSQDVEEVKKADNIEGVAAAYSKEVFYYYNKQNYVLKAISYSETDEKSPNKLNKPVLIEGRYPKEPGECLVEKKITAPDSFKIGSTLAFTDTDDTKQLTDSLNHSEYKIVGICVSPLYIGYKRDVTKAGNGSITCNFYLPESEFKAGYYTELYVRFKGVHELDQFSDEYKHKIQDIKQDAYERFQKSVTARYDKELSQAKRELDFAKKQVSNYSLLLQMNKSELESFDKQLIAQEKEIKKENSIFTDLELEKTAAQRKLVAGLIADKTSGKTDTADELSKQIEQYRTQIQKGEQTLSELPELKFYGFDRFEASSDYASYCGDANKIDSISKVFPVFFILIACLVCLTTMTRMVDEHRITIGTYKALGYSPARIASKYLFYGAAAAVLGSCIGTAIGLQVFPYIIYSCYKILYNIPSIDTPFKLWYMLGCCIVAVVCICGAVLYSCIRALKAQPSQLMRPKAPQSGRRVLLERIDFVWKRLSFLSKVTVRNLLRYKKRFFMTIVGVAGCTALIITGFGLKHSISAIVTKQFGEVLLYDGTLVLNNQSFTREQLEDKLSSLSQIEEYTFTYVAEGETTKGEDTATASFFVVDTPDKIHNYLSLNSADGSGRLSLEKGKCIITKKMSMLLNIKTGDKIEYQLDKEKFVTLTVSGIAENYAMHYIYIDPQTFEDLYGRQPDYNTVCFNFKDGADEGAFKNEVTACKEFYGVSLMSESGKDFLTSLDSLDAVVILLIVCAGLLAIVVLYNLANINITERVREIATIKVLGFYDIETSAYIYRENIITAILGIFIGAFVGVILHRFVVITSEVDIVLFDRSLVWWAFVLGALFTAVFTVIVNFVLHFKLKKIDMVESMKSVE